MSPAHDAPAPPDRPADAPADPPRKRRWRRWLGWTLAAALVVLIILVILLPTLASTAPGRRLILGAVDAGIPGSVTAERLSLAWFGGQSATNLRLFDPRGDLVMHVAQFEAPDVGLLPLAFGSRELGNVQVLVEAMHLTQQPGERTNLEQALVAQAPEPRQPQPPAEPGQPAALPEDLDVRLTFRAKRITYESPDVEPVELSDVDAQVNVPELRDISMTLNSQLRQGQDTGRIAADVNVLDAVTPEGQIDLDGAQINAQGELANLPIAAVDRLAGQGGRLEALLGSRLDAQFNAQGPIRQLDATVNAQSPNLEQLALQLAGGEEALRAADSTIRLQITPEAFAAFTAPPGGQPGGTTLTQPFMVDVNLAQLMIPRTEQGLDFNGAAVDLNVAATPIELDVPERGLVALRDTQLSVNAQDVAQLINAQLAAQAQLGEVTRPVQATLAVRNALGGAAPLEAQLQTQNLPVALVDAAAPMEGRDLATLLGETLGLQVTVQRPEGQPMAFQGQVDAPRLRGPFAGEYADDGALALRTPSPMELQLTPRSFEQWVAPAGEAGQPLELVEPTVVRLNLRNLQVATLEPEPGEPVDEAAPLRLDPERTRVFADVALPRAVLRNPQTQEQYTVEQAELTAEGQDLREVLQVLATMQVQTQEAAPPAEEAPAQPMSRILGRERPQQRNAQPDDAPPAPAAPRSGTLRTDTQLRGLLAPDGTLQPAQAGIVSATTLEAIPSALIDGLLGQGGQLAAILGPTTSADVQVDYKPNAAGNATLALNSANATGRIAAAFTEAGEVQLLEDPELAVQVTPAVSDVMLQRVNPMLAGAVAAEAPLRLSVQHEGFTMPLREFDWRKVNARARLAVEQLTLAPQGFAGTVLGLLNRFDVLGGESSYLAQVAPLDLVIERGELQYDRLALGMSGVELVFSGTVDLASRDLDLLMFLGGEELEGKGVADVAIPIAGTITQPRLNEQKLAQVFLQAGLREAIGEQVDGEAGDILGRVLGQPQRNGASNGGAQQQPEQPRDPLADILGAIRGATEQQQQEEQAQPQPEQDQPQMTEQERQERRERRRQRRERLEQEQQRQ